MSKLDLDRRRLADALFSPSLQGVLAVLYGEPRRAFDHGEILARVGEGIEVERHLEALAASGHIVARRVGRQQRYRANTESPIFPELRGIAVKTFAVVGPLCAAMGPLERHIRTAWLRGIEGWSDFELVAILKRRPPSTLEETLAGVDLGRPLRISAFIEEEWNRADRRMREHYAAEPRLVIFGPG